MLPVQKDKLILITELRLRLNLQLYIIYETMECSTLNEVMQIPLKLEHRFFLLGFS